MLNNIEINDLLDILYGCGYLYNIEEGHFQHIIEVVIKNFQAPSQLTPDQKANLYCYGLGTFYFLKNDFENALGWYDKAIGINPNHADALNNKGLALHKLENYEEAIKCFDKAINIDRNYANAFYNKANTLDILEKYQEAIECYDKVLEIRPDDREAMEGEIQARNMLWKLRGEGTSRQ
jgi:tetratricopeptide (TPR) repeat protein